MATSTITLTNELKAIFRETAQKLKGSERRQFMAKVVRGLGVGGQTQAERELGWNRGTIRKGMNELTSGIPIKDRFERRGRKRIESKLPNLLEDIRAIVEPHTQADPTLKSQRLYTRISAAKVRRQYHSKYNEVERTFGWLEQHWNGSLLDTVDTVLKFAQSLEFKGQRPVVKLVNQVYETGAKLSQKAMNELEKKFHRLPGLEKWFVEIPVSTT